MKKMADYRRRTAASILFRVTVVPSMLLCGIFRKPVFQWIAAAALGIWLIAVLVSALNRASSARKRKRDERRLSKLREPISDSDPDLADRGERELFLIRQINMRITDRLKASYPSVSWLWVRRPAVGELCKGGTWRIRTEDTGPYNFGEVTVDGTGRISITMLTAAPLGEAELLPEPDSLTHDDFMGRTDVASWYLATGEKLISDMIDDLNTQGHRKITIREDGEVIVGRSGSERSIEKIRDFPPRMAWPEFIRLLSEDEITAADGPDGLALSW